MATIAEAAQNCDPSLSLAQSGSGQGGNRSVPKKEREIHGVDFRVANWVFPEAVILPVVPTSVPSHGMQAILPEGLAKHSPLGCPRELAQVACPPGGLFINRSQVSNRKMVDGPLYASSLPVRQGIQGEYES